MRRREDGIAGEATRRRVPRQVAGVALLAAVAIGVLGGCATGPIPPTYTDAELKADCQRRGGWWRGELIAGYCEFQGAFLAP